MQHLTHAYLLAIYLPLQCTSLKLHIPVPSSTTKRALASIKGTQPTPLGTNSQQPKRTNQRDHASLQTAARTPQATSIKLTVLIHPANTATTPAAAQTQTTKSVRLTNLLRPTSKATTTAFFKQHQHVPAIPVNKHTSVATPCTPRRLSQQGFKTPKPSRTGPTKARTPTATAPPSPLAAATLMSKWQTESKPSAKDKAKHSTTGKVD